MAILYTYWCEHCKLSFEALRSPRDDVRGLACPKCGLLCGQDWDRKRTQVGRVDGELIGAYGHGTPEVPFHEITSGPNKGMTVVPRKELLFDDAKRKNDKNGTAIEWST